MWLQNYKQGYLIISKLFLHLNSLMAKLITIYCLNFDGQANKEGYKRVKPEFC